MTLIQPDCRFVNSMYKKQKTPESNSSVFYGDPSGNRTHDYAVRGRRLSRLTIGPSISLTIISHVKEFVNSFFEKN